MPSTDEILNLLHSRGGASYFGEPVTQLEHALQAAHLADREGAGDALVVAALLHDIGHLLQGLGEQAAAQGLNTRHEDLAAEWLAGDFGPAVISPLRLHVAAKRYLCAVDPTYLQALSPASAESLRLQGGPMSADEVDAFEREPYHADGIRLRRWDDLAKLAGLSVPGLEHYRARLAALSRTGSKPSS